MRWPRLVALSALGVYLLVSAASAFPTAWRAVTNAWRLRNEDAAAACRRAYGDTYWTGIEAVRRAIPPDGSYSLLWTGDERSGHFARFDLAPRKALYVPGGRRGPLQPFKPKDAPPWVVVVGPPGEAPTLTAADEIFSGETLAVGLEDEQLPANVDEPAEGETVSGEVVIRGWCQDLGGKPCASIHVFLDGEGRVPDRFERYPRPDVEAALSAIGKSDRAGFRAVFALGRGESGEHSAMVFFLAEDGRYRRFGPRKFFVETRSR